jgi:hypothetical protein
MLSKGLIHLIDAGRIKIVNMYYAYLTESGTFYPVYEYVSTNNHIPPLCQVTRCLFRNLCGNNNSVIYYCGIDPIKAMIKAKDRTNIIVRSFGDRAWTPLELPGRVSVSGDSLYDNLYLRSKLGLAREIILGPEVKFTGKLINMEVYEDGEVRRS